MVANDVATLRLNHTPTITIFETHSNGNRFRLGGQTPRGENVVGVRSPNLQARGMNGEPIFLLSPKSRNLR
jgi:hypothetical protein